MGFFDRFRKKDQPQEIIPPDAPLVFQPSGDFEIATCHGEYALRHLDQLRNEGRTVGFSAILLGDEEDAAGLAESRESSETSTKEYLSLADQVNVEEWLNQRVAEDPECYQTEEGDWPAEAPESGSITAHADIGSKKPKPVVYLAKIPTPRNWEIPAYIGMGGWNACPDASVLTAFAARWNERYGAEVVSITRDTIEFVVKNPPATREAALELAREQYIFCSDIVDQGVGDVTSLAATLLNSGYWFFWWD